MAAKMSYGGVARGLKGFKGLKRGTTSGGVPTKPSTTGSMSATVVKPAAASGLLSGWSGPKSTVPMTKPAARRIGTGAKKPGAFGRRTRLA